MSPTPLPSADGVVVVPAPGRGPGGREDLGAASLERPAIARRAGGGRLYLSCATAGSKRWWVQALDADTPDGLPEGRRTVVHAGGADVGVKDPVVLVAAGGGLAASSPHEDGALRYATAVARPGGGLRWYAEVAHADGSHDLVTSVSLSPGET